MNKEKITLVLACAGKGSRANLSYNKIFAKIDGESVITKTFSAFNQMKKIDEIIIVYSKGEKELIERELPPTDKILKFVEGGATRFLSVKNALDTIDSGFVLIHDGARPYINKESIDKIIKSVLLCGKGARRSKTCVGRTVFYSPLRRSENFDGVGLRFSDYCRCAFARRNRGYRSYGRGY